MKSLIITSLIVFFLTVLVLYLIQRNLIYYPDKSSPNLASFKAKDMQVVHLYTEDDLELTSWYKPASPNSPTILLLHGNAGHIGYRMPLGRELITKGFGLLLLEYRGYGGNPGKPTEEGLYRDARAAMAFLHHHHVTNIILYGESLGTGIATQIAIEYPVCALILQSPYTSLKALARYHYFGLPISPWDKFDSLTRIEKIKIPLLILHGTADQIVPYAQALSLYKQANQPKKMLSFSNKDHNNLWGPDFYQDINQFIEQYCQASENNRQS